MWNEMSCWVVDWDAIGAIATASAAVIALGMGSREVWIRNSSRRLRLRIAARLLSNELARMEKALDGFSVMIQAVINYGVKDPVLQEIEQALKAPVLNSYLDNADSLSDKVAVAIADVAAIISSYRWAILTKNPAPLYESYGKHETSFKAFEAAAATLRAHLDRSL